MAFLSTLRYLRLPRLFPMEFAHAACKLLYIDYIFPHTRRQSDKRVCFTNDNAKFVSICISGFVLSAERLKRDRQFWGNNYIY